MGQCPVSTEYHTYSMDEEEFSVAATPTRFLPACSVDLPSVLNSHDAYDRKMSSSGTSDHDSGVRKTFLKLHRPDVSQRCLIDPDEVNRVLSQQADELLRRRGLFPTLNKKVHDPAAPTMMHVLESTLSDELGEVGSRFGAASLVSGVTTATRSTIHTGNIRPKMTVDRNWSRRLKPTSGDGTVLSSLAGQHSSVASVLNSVAEQDEDSDLHQDVVDGTIDDLGSSQKLLADASMKMKSQLPIPALPTSFRGRLVHHQRNEVDLLRRKYMSVLRLNVKANMGFFYTQRYLLMFPDRPKPFGCQAPGRKNDPIPDLASESSDNSASSGNSRFIDYGAMPAATSIKCMVTNNSFLDLAITGSLGLVPRDKMGRNSSGQPKYLPRVGNQKSPDHYIVLISRRSGFPLAVCAMKAASGYPVVRIYATRQRVFAQRPAATTRQLGLEWADNLPLYAWAEVVSDGEFPNSMKFSVFMANGSEGRFSSQPSYEAAFSGGEHPVVKISGKTDMESTFSGCALISMCVDQSSGNDADVSFHLDLAKGIDPAMMICFTAIVDEVMETSMRTQCKIRARRRIRNVASSLAKKLRDGGV